MCAETTEVVSLNQAHTRCVKRMRNEHSRLTALNHQVVSRSNTRSKIHDTYKECVVPHGFGFQLGNDLTNDVVRAREHALHELSEGLIDTRIHPPLRALVWRVRVVHREVHEEGDAGIVLVNDRHHLCPIPVIMCNQDSDSQKIDSVTLHCAVQKCIRTTAPCLLFCEAQTPENRQCRIALCSIQCILPFTLYLP